MYLVRSRTKPIPLLGKAALNTFTGLDLNFVQERRHALIVSGVNSVSRIRTRRVVAVALRLATPSIDRKSTRLNSSHQIISYAVFCLKKKKKSINNTRDMSAKTETE